MDESRSLYRVLYVLGIINIWAWPYYHWYMWTLRFVDGENSKDPSS